MHAIVSGLVNVGLNIILCFVMKDKVAAVAISTVVSQMIGAFLVIHRLTHKDGNCSFAFKSPDFSFPDLAGMLRFAIPSALTHMMYPIAAVGPIIYFFFGEEVLSLYVPGDELAIFYGMKRLKYVLAFQMIAALNGIFAASIQAFGHPFLSTIESVITVLAFRVFWMNFIYPHYETIDALLFCFTCSWILHLILISATFAFAFTRYRRHAILREKAKISSLQTV